MQIPEVSKATFQKLKDRLMSDHQTSVTQQLTPETPGQILGHGVAADYTYDEATQLLSVEIKHHPFYIPAAVIEHELHAAVDAVRPVAVPA